MFKSLLCQDLSFSLINSDEFAEAIFHYCTQPHVFDSFSRILIDRDLSMAEYVFYYRLNDFKKFLEQEYFING